MSSHKKLTKRFSRRSGPRKMLVKGLLANLIENESITTTKVKAVEVKRHFDKLVTLAKRDTLNSYRILVAKLSNKDAAFKLKNSILPKLKDRSSGYTTIVKLPNRAGDNSPMAHIRLISN